MEPELPPPREVIDNPWDDVPRLALASDLEKTQPERAEFIRLQIGLETGRYPGMTPPPPGDELAQTLYRMRWMSLQSREVELRLQFSSEWAAPVAELCRDWEFHRGFIWCGTMTASEFLSNAEKLFDGAPITFLRLTEAKPVFERLLSFPQLRRLEALSLADNGLADGDAARVAECQHLSKIWWLDLSHNPIGMDGIKALARPAGLPNLWYVGLYGNPSDPRETFGHEGVTIVDARLPPGGVDLESEFGTIRWLHYHAFLGADYPPSPRQPPPAEQFVADVRI